MLVKLYIAVRYAGNDGRGHFWDFLAGLTLETVCHQPLTHELLRKLALPLPCRKPLLVALGIEVPRRIRSVYFIHQIYPVADFAEFVFGVDKDEAHLGGNLAATAVKGTGVFLKAFIILAPDKARSNDFLF